MIWIKATVNNLLQDKFVEGIVVNFSDLTKEKAALSEIHKKEHYYRSLVEHSFDGVVLYDKDGHLIFASDSAKSILGYDNSFESIQSGLDFVHPDDHYIPVKAWDEVLLRPFESIDIGDYRLVKRDGTTIWVQNTFTNLLDDPNVAGIVSNFRDISSKKNIELSLYKVSNFDSVTGLPNRKYLTEQLKQQTLKAIESKGQFGLVIIDINALNAINTTHGHSIGDQVIAKVAESIKNCVSANEFVAKVGDDEFAIIFSEQTTYEVSRKCQEIFDKFSQLINIDGNKVKVSLSAGISIYPKDAINPRNLISNADIALKNSKQSMEPFSFYKNHDSEHTRYRLDLEKDLIEAIANNDFYMVYQPILDTKTGEVLCLESLLRWEHPEKGNIPPGLFVRIAEESNLIGQLSQWVLTSVIQQISLWNEQNLYPQVTVNLSPLDIRRKNLNQYIVSRLQEHKVEPKSLILEITESEELLDLEFAIAQMNDLNQTGVGIILDDFGTGFSSISHLLNLPIKAAKIDKSFIQHIDQEANDFLRGIINLIQGSGLITIVEGIETTQQFQALSTINDLYGQGYLFSKPINVKQMTSFLKQGALDLKRFQAKR